MTIIIKNDVTKLYPLLALAGGCAFVCVIIVLLVGTNLYVQEPSKKPVKYMQYLSVSSLLSYVICLITQIFVILMLDNHYEVDTGNVYAEIIISTNYLSWTFGQIFMYGLFIANLHHTFKNTSLQISKTMFNILYAFVAAFFISRLVYAMYWEYYYKDIVTPHQFSTHASMLIFVTECIDLILSIILMFLFVKKLFALFVVNHKHKRTMKYEVQNNIKIQSSTDPPLLIQESTNTHSRTDNAIVKSVTMEEITPSYHPIDTSGSLNIRQKSILYIASKYAILSSIAIISTQLYLLSTVNNAISFRGLQTNYYYISFKIHCVLLSLDCLSNAICICLNFEFNELWYVVLCWSCDQCCHSICRCIARRCNYKKK